MRRSLQNSHLTSLRKKEREKKKSKPKRARENDRCRGVHVCRASGKFRAQILNSHLTSLRKKRKKDKKSKPRGQEINIGVVSCMAAYGNLRSQSLSTT